MLLGAHRETLYLARRDLSDQRINQNFFVCFWDDYVNSIDFEICANKHVLIAHAKQNLTATSKKGFLENKLSANIWVDIN